jgi:outer membrane protein assembly factor BamB/ABC-type transport system involved in multi-copper enzyme maturation permease subunit
MLRFFTTIAGPVFAKEMVEMARRKRYYFNRVFFGAVLLFTLFMVYITGSWRYMGGSDDSIQAMAALSESMFIAASSVQYAAVYLFVPLFVCGVIASEREEKTLDLLFTTQLRDREIVLGKLLSRLAALVMLILCAMPVMSLIMLLGGIDFGWVWRVMASTLLASIFVGAHAIYFSAITKSPSGALVRTYFWLGVFLLAIPGAGAIIVSSFVRNLRDIDLVAYYFGSLAFLHPLGSFMPALVGELYDGMTRMLSPWWPGAAKWFFPFTFLLPLLWSMFVIWRAVCRLRLQPTIFGGLMLKLPVISHFREWRHHRQERRRRGRGLAHASRWLYVIPITNPLWLRSRVARVYDREGHIGRLQWATWGLAAAFLLLVVVVETRSIHQDECAITFLVIAWLAFLGLTIVIAGMSLTADRRRGLLELVLATPLTGREIIDGTLLAVWQHLRRLYWLIVVLGMLFVVTGAIYFHHMLASLLTGTLFCLVLVMHGVGCSVAARSMAGALAPTFAFPVVVLALLPFLVPIFEEEHAPVLWIITAIFLGASWFWVRHRPSAASVGCFLLAMHMAICALFTSWMWPHFYSADYWRSRTAYSSYGNDYGYYDKPDELPVAAMNAAYLTIATLERRDLESIYRRWGPARLLALPTFWMALILNLIWARWWLVRNFDRLAGRLDPRLKAVSGKAKVRSDVIQPAAVLVLFAVTTGLLAAADNWPRWRGAEGKAVSTENSVPTRWGPLENVRWKTAVPGEGFSSPIVWGERVFLTSAFEKGIRRAVHALDRQSGKILWSREITHQNPEIASAMTGHAAATPVTDGERVIAVFGNAGVICYDFEGQRLWQRDLGEFESELGLASSPIIHDGRVILVCDHDGTRPRSFDSYMMALDVRNGAIQWKTPREGLERSWSTPIVVPGAAGKQELVVSAQDHLRGYDPETGKELWRVGGMTGWVTPSPVFGHGLIFATSGKAGPVLAVRPGGRGDVTATHVVWQHANLGPYVCSPLLHGDCLYVHNEQGVLTCFDARTGKQHYRERLEGKFIASAVAAGSSLYVSNEDGTTFVIRAGTQFGLLAKNRLNEYTLASPAISGECILVRTEKHLWCLATPRLSPRAAR